MVLTSLFIRRTCHRFAIWQGALVWSLSSPFVLSLSKHRSFLDDVQRKDGPLRLPCRRSGQASTSSGRTGSNLHAARGLSLRIAIGRKRERQADRGAAPDEDGARHGHRPDGPPGATPQPDPAPPRRAPRPGERDFGTETEPKE